MSVSVKSASSVFCFACTTGSWHVTVPQATLHCPNLSPPLARRDLDSSCRPSSYPLRVTHSAVTPRCRLPTHSSSRRSNTWSELITSSDIRYCTNFLSHPQIFATARTSYHILRYLRCTNFLSHPQIFALHELHGDESRVICSSHVPNAILIGTCSPDHPPWSRSSHGRQPVLQDHFQLHEANDHSSYAGSIPATRIVGIYTAQHLSVLPATLTAIVQVLPGGPH